MGSGRRGWTIGIALSLVSWAAPVGASPADEVGERAEAAGYDAAFMLVRVVHAFASRRIVEVTEVAQWALERALAPADAAEARGRAAQARIATIAVQGGIDRQVVARVLRRQRVTVDVVRCVAALRPSLRPSTLEIRWFDGGSGIPTGAAVVGRPQADRLSRCVRRAVEDWRLPKPLCTAIISVRFEIDAR
mgnify:CR=1 FL=1